MLSEDDDLQKQIDVFDRMHTDRFVHMSMFDLAREIEKLRAQYDADMDMETRKYKHAIYLHVKEIFEMRRRLEQDRRDSKIKTVYL